MMPLPTQIHEMPFAPIPATPMPQMSPRNSTSKKQRESPRTSKNQSQAGGYSVLSQEDANRLLDLLKSRIGDFQRKRKEHINRQRSMRSWKADFVTKEECLEFAGETSPAFKECIDHLGVF